MPTAVFGIVRNKNQAEDVVQQLHHAGFSSEDVSVLMADKGGTTNFAVEHKTKAPEGATAGAGTGGVLGGTLGLLAGIGAIAIPGLGPFIAAGPIMAALSGAAVGAAVGGVTGALIGMGIPEYEAKRYEGHLKDGKILISAHADDSNERARAKAIFERAGVEDIATAAEESVPHR